MEAYETVYNVGLLDDIHNYFPDILYRPSRFATVPDLLLYVQQSVQRRFNLLEYGRRLNTPRNTFARETRDPSTAAQVLFSISGLSGLSGLPGLSGLNGLNNLSGLEATNLSSLFQDIAVHASQTIIDGASTVITLEEDIEENCSVCQDRLRQGEIVRKLTACNHTFHRSCVDNWLLQSSVRCPTCRHDIRIARDATQDTRARHDTTH